MVAENERLTFEVVAYEETSNNWQGRAERAEARVAWLEAWIVRAQRFFRGALDSDDLPNPDAPKWNVAAKQESHE